MADMKKNIVISVLALLCLTTAMAQEQDPWVGTWTSESYTDMDWENSPKDSEGTFTEIINTDYKLVIRITKSGDQYNVRAKTIKVKDPNYSSFHKPFTIKRISGNTMWLESYLKKDPFRVNGVIDEYSDITYYYKLTLKDGTLHYSFYKYHSVDYDRNMRYKGEEDYNASVYSPRGSELDLFNDDW